MNVAPTVPSIGEGGISVPDAIRAATVQLAVSFATARLDAELLMAHALGLSRGDMLLRQRPDLLQRMGGMLSQQSVPLGSVVAPSAVGQYNRSERQ